MGFSEQLLFHDICTTMEDFAISPAPSLAHEVKASIILTVTGSTPQDGEPLDLLLWLLSSLELIWSRPIDWPQRWSDMCSCHYLLLVEIKGEGRNMQQGSADNRYFPQEPFPSSAKGGI